MADEMEDMRKMERERRKTRAAQKLNAASEARQVARSSRIRRRAREIFTDMKASGKLPKGAKFEDLGAAKFFKAAKDIDDSEIRREIEAVALGKGRDQLKQRGEGARKELEMERKQSVERGESMRKKSRKSPSFQMP